MTLFDNTEFQIVNLMFPIHKILFHGKRIDSEEWVEGHYFTKVYSENTLNEYWAHIIKSKSDGVEYEVIPKTINQYTGINDVDGRKAFLCDAIQTSRFGIGVIYYNPLTYQISVKFKQGMACTLWEIKMRSDFKIICSVFDYSQRKNNTEKAFYHDLLMEQQEQM